MKINKIIYWTSTAIIAAMMLFSGISGLTNPQFAETYKHFGYPDYFRVELSVAKIIGLLVLLIPQIPIRIKEWAYAGFGITFVSASIAHAASGDPAGNVVTGIVFFIILVVSNIYLYKSKIG